MKSSVCVGDVEKIPYLNYDQVADALAVSFHSKSFVLVASRDVELDAGAAAAWVIVVCCADGQHRVSHINVLC